MCERVCVCGRGHASMKEMKYEKLQKNQMGKSADKFRYIVNCDGDGGVVFPFSCDK